MLVRHLKLRNHWLELISANNECRCFHVKQGDAEATPVITDILGNGCIDNEAPRIERIRENHSA